ncbi:hypothetical protein [Seonamhaeicola sp. S2-3]|nr:hypothetical protein [Seonamhaeicola sp. S2-3]
MFEGSIALYNWTNGVIMMIVFGLICISLVAALIIFMSGGKKKDKTD